MKTLALQYRSRKKTTFSTLLLFCVGFVHFFLQVIVADLYGGAGIANLFVLGLNLLAPLFLVEKSIDFKVPFELISYILFIVGGQLFKRSIPPYFIFALCNITGALLLARYIARDFETRFYSYIKGLMAGISFSCLYYMIFASTEYSDDVDGVRNCLHYFSISSAGFMGAIAFLWSFANLLIKNYNKRILVVLILSIALLFYSMSKNALFSIAIVSFLLMLFTGKVRLNKSFILILFLVLIVFLIFRERISSIFEMVQIDTDGNIEDGDFSINGRGVIWAKAIMLFSDSPLYGYGYWDSIIALNEAFGGLADLTEDRSVFQAHNMILQALVSVGLIGTTLLFLFIARTVRNLIFLFKFHEQSDEYLWILGCMLYFVFRGLTEGSISQAGTIDCFFFILFSELILFMKERDTRILKSGCKILSQNK